jgi:exosortase A-associated hydrolase 1
MSGADRGDGISRAGLGRMSFAERPVLFECEGERLVGIVAVPEQSARVAVLVVVGGPQYRAGSHRQFVRLARALAAAGFPAMRFDYRGMGDSTGAARTFEDCGPDIAAAVGALRASCPDVERVVLWGLCDAASAALGYWLESRDPSIAGMVLLNPWVRSETTLAKAHIKHYYGRRLLAKDFWAKALSGGVRPVEAARTFVRNLRTSLARPGRAANAAVPAFQDRMAAALRAFPGPVLLVLSGEDLTAKEFLEYAQSDAKWQGLLQRAGIERHDLPRADHTFSSGDAAGEVESRTLAWLRASFAPGGAR